MKDGPKIWSAILVGAFLVAWLCVRTVSLRLLGVFLMAVLIIGVVVRGAVWVLVWLQRRDPVAKEMSTKLIEINQLSIETAREKATQILQDINRFKCVRASSPPPEEICSLGVHVSNVLGVYERIETVKPDTCLGWNEMGRSDLNPEFIRIGYCIDGTEIAVKPSADIVYLIDGSEAGEADVAGDSYPSIYHLILATYTNVYEVGEQS